MTTLSCNTDLLAAVEEADLSVISQCLERGGNVNAASKNGWTPLMVAVLRGSSAIVALLLERGADPNLTTQSQENPFRSPLVVAIRNGRLDAVQALVANNADINGRDTAGLTPTELARKLSLRPLHQDKMIAIALFLQQVAEGSVRRPAELVAG